MQIVTNKSRGGYADVRQNRLYIKVIRDKEGHYILIRDSIQQEDTTIVNIYTPNDRPAKFTEQKLTELKGEIDSCTIIIRDFNIPLSTMDRTTTPKVSKEIEYLINTRTNYI